MCREKIAEIAKQYGVEIIFEPKEREENGLDLLSYKVREIKREIETLQSEFKQLAQKNDFVKKSTRTDS